MGLGISGLASQVMANVTRVTNGAAASPNQAARDVKTVAGTVFPAAVLAVDLLMARVPGSAQAGGGAGAVAPAAPSSVGGGAMGAPASGAAGRDPVILVHGFASSSASMESYAQALRRDGHDVTMVDMPANAQGDINASSAVLAQQVEAVKRRTGSSRVDLVGHSEGGLISRNYVENYGGANSVDSVVTLGTPNNGVGLGAATNQAVLGSSFMRSLLPTALQQMLTGSGFLGNVNGSDGTLDPRVRYTSVYNGLGDGVVAADSSRLDGARNVALPGAVTRNHAGLLTDDLAYASVREALDGSPSPTTAAST